MAHRRSVRSIRRRPCPSRRFTLWPWAISASARQAGTRTWVIRPQERSADARRPSVEPTEHEVEDHPIERAQNAAEVPAVSALEGTRGAPPPPWRHHLTCHSPTGAGRASSFGRRPTPSVSLLPPSADLPSPPIEVPPAPFGPSETKSSRLLVGAAGGRPHFDGGTSGG